MRFLFILWFFTCSYCFQCVGNSFQVIILQGRVLISAKNVEVKKLDRIQDSESLYVPRDGYIALLDNFTNVFEFYGEQMIRLETLIGRSQGFEKYPDLKMLYSTDRQLVKIHDDSGPRLLLISPFLFSNNIAVRDSLRMMWTDNHTDVGKYQIKLDSEYGDVLLRNDVSSKEYLFVPTELQKKYGVCLMSIEFIGMKSKFESDKKRITFGYNGGQLNDVTANINSSAGCLLIALYLETYGQLDDALFYYNKAEEHAKEILDYRTIVANFKARRS